VLVQQVIARLRVLGATSVRKLDGVIEDVRFPLPRGLGDRSMAEAAAGAGKAAVADAESAAESVAESAAQSAAEPPPRS
jgi:hypothetical protein